MFVKFLIIVMFAGVANAEIEGGADAVKEKGVKPAVVQALSERQMVDYTKMND